MGPCTHHSAAVLATGLNRSHVVQGPPHNYYTVYVQLQHGVCTPQTFRTANFTHHMMCHPLLFSSLPSPPLLSSWQRRGGAKQGGCAGNRQSAPCRKTGLWASMHSHAEAAYTYTLLGMSWSTMADSHISASGYVPASHTRTYSMFPITSHSGARTFYVLGHWPGGGPNNPNKPCRGRATNTSGG